MFSNISFVNVPKLWSSARSVILISILIWFFFILPYRHLPRIILLRTSNKKINIPLETSQPRCPGRAVGHECGKVSNWKMWKTHGELCCLSPQQNYDKWWESNETFFSKSVWAVKKQPHASAPERNTVIIARWGEKTTQGWWLSCSCCACLDLWRAI